MNTLDFIVIGIFGLTVIFCTAKGLILSLFNLLSLLISFLLAQMLYPYVAEFLRQTVMHTAMAGVILRWLRLDNLDTGRGLTDVVGGLNLPDALKQNILDGVGGTSYGILGIGESIADFLAGIAINAISILLVFVLVFLLMRIVAVLLRVVSRLPVIRTFNRIGGALMGFAMGAVLSWLVLFILNGLFSANPGFPVAELLEESALARFFMQN